PARSRRGGILSALIFVCLIVGLAAIVGAIVVTKDIRIRTGQHDLAIDTPGGRLDIRTHKTLDPALVGVPIYPGATRLSDSGGGAHIEWTSADGDGDSLWVMAGEYRTNDSARVVLDFYRRQLPNLIVVSERGRDTDLEYRKGGIRRIIAIREKHDGTRIGVATIGGRESN
ncbi:MAG TPA: hypothetical protein VHC72_17030, partial [Bryobacteraceae bacterium]|nr:hypothetical protein [Bryobacteraceae bacterium]